MSCVSQMWLKTTGLELWGCKFLQVTSMFGHYYCYYFKWMKLKLIIHRSKKSVHTSMYFRLFFSKAIKCVSWSVPKETSAQGKVIWRDSSAWQLITSMPFSFFFSRHDFIISDASIYESGSHLSFNNKAESFLLIFSQSRNFSFCQRSFEHCFF